jgi:hypothetical protein
MVVGGRERSAKVLLEALGRCATESHAELEDDEPASRSEYAMHLGQAELRTRDVLKRPIHAARIEGVVFKGKRLYATALEGHRRRVREATLRNREGFRARVEADDRSRRPDGLCQRAEIYARATANIEDTVSRLQLECATRRELSLRHTGIEAMASR